MADQALLQRIAIDPQVCGGKPCIRGTRIPIAVILDTLSEGKTPKQVIDAYPALALEDVMAALAYAGLLAQENTWRLSVA